jgi:hypothetical protein
MANSLSHGVFKFGLERSVLYGEANLALNADAEPVPLPLLRGNAWDPKEDKVIVLGTAQLAKSNSLPAPTAVLPATGAIRSEALVRPGSTHSRLRCDA